MNVRDMGLALAVVAVWGANFTAIKIGLADVPPMLLVAARYIVVALPAVFFIPRPNISVGRLVAYGLTVGVGQFTALFYALHLGMPAGLSSVVLQVQAFFTPLLAYWLLQEPTGRRQWAGMAVAGAGLLLIGLNSGTEGGIVASAIPAGALLLTLLAAAFWALSNIIVRRAAQDAAARGGSLQMVGLIVWSALVPPVPMMLLARLFHGPDVFAHAAAGAGAAAVAAIAFIAYGATVFGYGVWSRLLSTYPAGVVAPFSLLVPVTGLLTSGVILGERLTAPQWLGSLAVAAGLLMTLWAPGHRPRKA